MGGGCHMMIGASAKSSGNSRQARIVGATALPCPANPTIHTCSPALPGKPYHPYMLSCLARQTLPSIYALLPCPANFPDAPIIESRLYSVHPGSTRLLSEEHSALGLVE